MLIVLRLEQRDKALVYVVRCRAQRSARQLSPPLKAESEGEHGRSLREGLSEFNLESQGEPLGSEMKCLAQNRARTQTKEINHFSPAIATQALDSAAQAGWRDKAIGNALLRNCLTHCRWLVEEVSGPKRGSAGYLRLPVLPVLPVLLVLPALRGRAGAAECASCSSRC